MIGHVEMIGAVAGGLIDLQGLAYQRFSIRQEVVFLQKPRQVVEDCSSNNMVLIDQRGSRTKKEFYEI